MNHLLSNYHLGLPAWAYAGWKGVYFSAHEVPLRAYARVFNTVEGNTSFYQIPSPAMVAGWCDVVNGTPFKFCFKLPRTVTHDAQSNQEDLHRFLKVIEPLGENLGPLLIQLSDRIGPAQMDWLTRLCEQLPQSFRHVVEVRHPRWFSHPQELEPLLERFRMGRVIMDTRPLFHGNHQHPEVQDALRKKPDVPVLTQVYNDLTLLRLILHPELGSNRGYLDEWAQRMAEYLRQGHTCHVMVHCANNQYAPELAADFHQQLRQHLTDAIPALPDWDVPQQQGLF